MPCNYEKLLFAVYWALQYDMYMCVNRKVEDELFVHNFFISNQVAKGLTLKVV